MRYRMAKEVSILNEKLLSVINDKINNRLNKKLTIPKITLNSKDAYNNLSTKYEFYINFFSNSDRELSSSLPIALNYTKRPKIKILLNFDALFQQHNMKFNKINMILNYILSIYSIFLPPLVLKLFNFSENIKEQIVNIYKMYDVKSFRNYCSFNIKVNTNIDSIKADSLIEITQKNSLWFDLQNENDSNIKSIFDFYKLFIDSINNLRNKYKEFENSLFTLLSDYLDYFVDNKIVDIIDNYDGEIVELLDINPEHLEKKVYLRYFNFGGEFAYSILYGDITQNKYLLIEPLFNIENNKCVLKNFRINITGEFNYKLNVVDILKKISADIEKSQNDNVEKLKQILNFNF